MMETSPDNNNGNNEEIGKEKAMETSSPDKSDENDTENEKAMEISPDKSAQDEEGVKKEEMTDISPGKTEINEGGIEQKASFEETTSIKSEDKKPAAKNPSKNQCATPSETAAAAPSSMHNHNNHNNSHGNGSSSIEYDATLSTLSLSARNIRYNDPSFDPSAESSVSSTASKTKSPIKIAHNSKRRAPPVGYVVVHRSTAGSSISSLSNSLVVARRRNSLRSHGSIEIDGSNSSVSSNLSSSSRRIGLMGRLLMEMHIIEKECFDDADSKDSNLLDDDDDFEDWL